MRREPFGEDVEDLETERLKELDRAEALHHEWGALTKVFVVELDACVIPTKPAVQRGLELVVAGQGQLQQVVKAHPGITQ